MLLLLPTRPFTLTATRGAHDQDRTGDLVLTKDVLYQLSYVGELSHHTLAQCYYSLHTRLPALPSSFFSTFLQK
jgi:hypothetical protein